jgi:hypothetical protein
VQREVLGITIYSHRDLETLLNGFNQAYNRRRQRVLKGASPEQVVQRRLAAEPKLANGRFKPPDPRALPQALQVVAHAKEVSHPDTYSTRARIGATVSTPVSWDELPSIRSGAQYRVGNLAARLSHLNRDPWNGFDQVDQVLPSSLKAKRRR